MDNALIDDRRIRVDFRQSVSKLWNQFRRKNIQGGKGCYKCGALDHIAKDCADGSTIPPQKYVGGKGCYKCGALDQIRLLKESKNVLSKIMDQITAYE